MLSRRLGERAEDVAPLRGEVCAAEAQRPKRHGFALLSDRETAYSCAVRTRPGKAHPAREAQFGAFGFGKMRDYIEQAGKLGFALVMHSIGNCLSSIQQCETIPGVRTT